MTTPKHKNRGLPKLLLLAVAAVVLLVMGAVLYRLTVRNSIPVDSALVERLKSAKHFQSQLPAQKQTIGLAKMSDFRQAALNAIGMELRDVRAMATGNPDSVFAMLSHLGGFGEIIWVDQWTNFPIKLPATDVPRREAVRAVLDAIEASGGCLIKAGESRYLVARASEKEKYDAAIRALGWLEGTPPPWPPPPWHADARSDKSKAEPDGATNGTRPIRLETNRMSSAAGSHR